MDGGTTLTILTGLITILVFGFGYLYGRKFPERGQIILFGGEPHNCKGIPRRTKFGIPIGSQWICYTCDDIWELQGTYDGIEVGVTWQRIKTTNQPSILVEDKRTNHE